MKEINYTELAKNKMLEKGLKGLANHTSIPKMIGEICGELVKNNAVLPHVRLSLRFSERDVDFAYLCGVFNVSGIDGLHKEIQRLKAIGKDPHDIIEACRKQ
jgi:hypothetical protein